MEKFTKIADPLVRRIFTDEIKAKTIVEVFCLLKSKDENEAEIIKQKFIKQIKET